MHNKIEPVVTAELALDGGILDSGLTGLLEKQALAVRLLKQTPTVQVGVSQYSQFGS